MSDRTPTPPELVPADDTIIGKAFKWSLAVIVPVAAIVIIVVIVARRERETAPVIVPKDPGRIAGLDSEAPAMPAVEFLDVTEEAGIDFVQVNGDRGRRLLPETMGGGCAFLDYDDDGDQDLLLVNGSAWPWDEPAGPPATSALYRNDGAGGFANVTGGSGFDTSLYGMGTAVGDYDNDGRVDVFITAVGPNRLFRNVGGRFEEVTGAAGVAGGADQWSSGAAFLDADNDGDLDLFVGNYVEWSREIDLELNYTLNGTDRAYGPPTNFRGAHPYLYLNNGDGTFTDVSAAAGLHVRNPATGLPVGKSLGLAPIDLDADGDLDVIVANDTTQNFLFENDGTGSFTDRGAESGVAFDGMGRSTGAMGIDAAFFRNDEDLAVGMGNFANEMTSFYVMQTGSSQFSDDAIVEGVGSPSRLVLSFGLFFFDYDLDGRLDLLQANGHLEESINQVQPSQHYRQPAQLFWNCGPDAPTTYAAVPGRTCGDLARPIVGRGAAFADIDGDGDLDVLITQVGGPPLLLRNDQALGRHWLRVKLVGRHCNRDAIGAWIELTAGGRTQRRQVMPTRSYLSQVELPVTFGLGDADRVDRLEVRWPDGSRQLVDVSDVDRLLVIEQSTDPLTLAP